MSRHLDALVLLQRIWGGFGLIVSAALATLAAGTTAALDQSGVLSSATLGLIWVLATCAFVLAAGGVATLAAARGLQRRSPFGRAAALALALINLVIVPFGTAVGAYTFWTLLNDDARREFGRPLRGAAAR
jgi:hypothetical protein